MSTATKPTANNLDAFFMPFTANRQFKKNPRLLAKAKGVHYWTPEGRKIIDGTAGLWCVNAGHGREEIKAAIAAQLEEMDYAPSFQMGHPKSFELAARHAAMLPGDLNHAFYCNSGSEAVDSALKIALAYQRARGQGTRTRLIGRERGYHGVGFGGIAADRHFPVHLTEGALHAGQHAVLLAGAVVVEDARVIHEPVVDAARGALLSRAAREREQVAGARYRGARRDHALDELAAVGRRARDLGKDSAGIGVAGLFGYHFVYFSAIRAAPAVEVSLIAYLWPLFLVVFSSFLPGERLRLHHIVGVVLAIAAFAVLMQGILGAGHAAALRVGDAEVELGNDVTALRLEADRARVDGIAGRRCSACGVLVLRCVHGQLLRLEQSTV